MKKNYYLLAIMLFGYTTTNAQVGTNFDEPYGATSDYIDPDYLTEHQLQNNPGQGTVEHINTGNELGFVSVFTPSRSGSAGSSGLSDGDTVGVYNASMIVSSTDVASWSTGNAYVIEDTDGMLTITFDTVNLSGTTNPRFQMVLWVDSTSYEFNDNANDRIYFRLEVDNGASTINILDSDGGGSGGSGASGNDMDLLTYNSINCEYTITNIDVDLTSYVGSTVQLIIEADFNTSFEKIIIDSIQFTEGSDTVLGVSENKILEKQLQVYPNPNNGSFTLNYNGNKALEQLSVFDITGKLIKSQTLKGFDKNQSFDFTNLAKGMYFLKIQTANSTVSKRISIK